MADAKTLAVTERGTRLKQYSEADVELTLRLLILNGGDVGKTVRQLGEEAILVSHDAVRYWRDVGFPSRYNQLRQELSQDVSATLISKSQDIAIQASDAEAAYVERALEKIEEVSPDKLAAAALSLAKTKETNVHTSQLLQNRPTEIRETRDTTELLEFFKKQGMLIRDPRFEDLPDLPDKPLEVEAEEVEVEPPPPAGKDEGSSDT